MFRQLLYTSVLVVGFSATISAQNPDATQERGVARISVINGDVSVRRGDSGDLIAAAINDASRKVDAQLGQSMSGLLGSLKLP